MIDQNQKYPEGHFVGMWIGIGAAIGSGLGVAFAIAIGNMALMGIGIPIGIAIGVGIGSAQEAQYKAKGLIRPHTEAEKKQRKVAMWIGLATLLAGFLVLIAVFMLK